MHRSPFFGTAALLLLVAVVLGRIATHEFVNLDDDKFIYANPNYLPPTLASLANLWRAAHAHLYVPVTMSAWWLVAQAGLVRDGSAGGGAGARYALNPWVFHIASLLVHAVNVLLVRRVVRSITRDDLAAVLGAAVFAIHPLQVEAVAWASELKDLLAAMFSLLAIACALQAIEHDARRPAVWWGGAIGCFIFALLSKPSAVTLPVVAAAVLWMLRDRDAGVAGSKEETRAAQASPARKRIILAVLFVGFLIALPIALVTRAAQPAIDVPATARWQRPLVAADAIAFYLGKLIVPLGMTVDYGRTPAAVFTSRAAYWTWIVPVVVTALVLLRGRRALIGAWVIFIAAPAANLGLLPFDFQMVSTVADHYVYLGLLGVAIAVAWFIKRWPRVRIAAVTAVAVLGVLTFIHAGRWRDSYSLWRHAIAVRPASGLAHVNLGVAYLSDGRPHEALPLLVRAAAIDPHDPFAHLNVIRARLAVGDTAGATEAAEDLVAAYRRRADFDPALVAAVLERFADVTAARGDEPSARRLREEAWRLRNP